MSKPRRQFSAEFKLETVLEALRGEKTIAQICRERDIKDSLVYKWREHFEQHAAEVFGEGGTDQRYQAQAARSSIHAPDLYEVKKADPPGADDP